MRRFEYAQECISVRLICKFSYTQRVIIPFCVQTYHITEIYIYVHSKKNVYTKYVPYSYS